MKFRNIIVQCCLLGDTGKGATVDFLASKYKSKLGVRFGGGAQCAHNVVVNGVHHCFSQLSAASFNGANTLLLKDVVFNPYALKIEMESFKSKTGLSPTVFVDRRCLITTPYHIAKNCITERALKHGSCGAGIWATKEYAEKYPESALRVSDLDDSNIFTEKCREIQKNILSELEGFNKKEGDDDWLHANKWEDFQYLYGLCAPTTYIRLFESEIHALTKNGGLIFEGHQGVLLDENHGYMPYVSGSGDCTSKAAEDFLKDIGQDYEIVGCIRPYFTRHGAGPFQTEMEIQGSVDEYNGFNEWQGAFRAGLFNMDEMNRVLGVQRVDSLSISCLDNDPFDSYWYGEEILFYSKRGSIHRAKELSQMIGKPIKCVSFGPSREQRKLYEWKNF